jgi:hypothetical protein
MTPGELLINYWWAWALLVALAVAVLAITARAGRK